MPRYVLENVFIKSYSTNGSTESDSFDFDFSNGEVEDETAGLLLPAVQSVREGRDYPKPTTDNVADSQWFADTSEADDGFLF
jgi:hypothetical protein